MKRVGSLPLQEYELVHASDPSYVHEMTSRVFSPYELGLIGRKPRFDARLHCCRLVDTAINFVTFGSEVRVEGGPTSTYFVIMVPWSGRVDVRFGHHRFTMSRIVASVVSPGDEDVAVHLYENAALLVCRIERPALEAHLAGVLGESLSRPLRFAPFMSIDRRGSGGLCGRLRALVHDIDDRGDVIEHSASTRAFEVSLMTDLLVAQPSNYTAALAADVKAIGGRDVRHAVALMESHPELPLSVTEVATALNISERSLQRGLRRDLGTTFRGALHDIRLRRVRDDLRRSAPGTISVHDVFVRWGLPLEGYTYTGYRKRYGETPSETLHSLG